MSKKKNGGVDAAELVDLDGFEQLEAGEDPGSDATWVEQLNVNDVFQGTLEDAFLVPPSKAGERPRVVYVINEGTAEEPNRIKLGERAGLKVLRDLPAGSTVLILVTGEDDLGNNRTAWRFKVQAKRAEGRRVAPLLEKLKREHKKLDEVPF